MSGKTTTKSKPAAEKKSAASSSPAAISSSSSHAASSSSSGSATYKTVEEFIAAHKSEIEKLPNGKIRCVPTGTDMPARLEIMVPFWNGKVYRQTKKKLEEEQHGPLDISAYAPHIIEHKRLTNKVYCRRTKRILNREKGEIERHMQGRRFLFAMKSYKPRAEPTAKPTKSEATSGDDDVWARMGLPDEVAAADGIEDEDPDAESDEEEDIERAIRRQMRGTTGSDDEDGEDDEDEDDEDGEDDEEDDEGFEEVPMDENGGENGEEEGEDDDEEEEEEEEERPPAKKTKNASGAAVAAPKGKAAVAASKKPVPAAAAAAPAAKKPAAKAAPAPIANDDAEDDDADDEDTKLPPRGKKEKEAPKAAPRPAASKKQVEDHRSIGPPSKRDVKAAAKKGVELKDPEKERAAAQKAASAAAPVPGQSGRLNASDKRKLKKAQQKAKQEAAGAQTGEKRKREQ